MTASAPESRHCIIGAGYAGLGVAKALADAGVTFDCLERNLALGGNWLDGVYDSTHIISSRDSTGYADFPMPADYPDFPSKAQVLAYLNAFADAFDLRRRIRFGTEVSSVRPLSEDGMAGWRVRLANGEEHDYASVVVANGHHWDRRIPTYPGKFAGKALHSKDYKNPGDLAGKRVLVVGAGNSGCDIAVEAAKSGFDTAISMRRGYYFLPKTIFGIPTAELDRPWLPTFAQKLLLKAAMAISAGSNERNGLEKPDHKLFEHHPVVNSQLLYAIRHGVLQTKPDIQRLDGNTVHFVDGTSREFDTIVWATGFNISFPFLDRALFEWKNGVPMRVGGMLVPGKAGLYVFGLGQPRGGAGPLITKGSALLAAIVKAQEEMDHPIVSDFARLRKPDARMLFGVQEVMREIAVAHRLVRLFARRSGKRAKRAAEASRPRPAPPSRRDAESASPAAPA